MFFTKIEIPTGSNGIKQENYTNLHNVYHTKEKQKLQTNDESLESFVRRRLTVDIEWQSNEGFSCNLSMKFPHDKTYYWGANFCFFLTFSSLLWL